MDIETLLRLAKKQSWWNAFRGQVRRDLSPEELAECAIKANDYILFVARAFYWKGSKEGFDYWRKVANDFCKLVEDYEKSIPTFKAYEDKILVARFVGWEDRQPGDVKKLKDLAAKTLNDNNIAFDLIVVDDDEIKAFKREPYFVRE